MSDLDHIEMERDKLVCNHLRERIENMLHCDYNKSYPGVKNQIRNVVAALTHLDKQLELELEGETKGTEL